MAICRMSLDKMLCLSQLWLKDEPLNFFLSDLALTSAFARIFILQNFLPPHAAA